MSRDNVRVVRQIFEAFRRDWAVWNRIITPTSSGTTLLNSPDAGVHHGVGGIRRFFVDLLETGDEWHVEVEDVSSVAPQRVFSCGDALSASAEGAASLSRTLSSSCSTSTRAGCVECRRFERLPRHSKPPGCRNRPSVQKPGYGAAP